MTTLIKQKTRSDCALTAIAMAAGKTHEELWTQEDLYKVVANKGVGDIKPWMDRAGFLRDVHYREFNVWGSVDLPLVRGLLWKRRALLSVNSLNIDGGSHMVYWDGEQVFDPSTLRTYKFLHSMVITQVVVFNDAVAA